MRSWEEINLKLVSMIGFDGDLILEAQPEGSNAARVYQLPVSDYMVRQDPPQPLQSLGITPWRPNVPAVLGQVVEGQPASQAGLRVGDRIVSLNGEPIDDWMQFVSVIRENAGQTLDVGYQRGNEQSSLSLTPARNTLESGSEVGYIGAGAQQVSWPEEQQREIRYGPIEAVGQALSRTGEMTLLTVDAIRKMLVGLISPSNLSGPITIAQISGDSARAGMEVFIGFLAYLSISLGVLNLLPIPVLDGGHLLYYFIEVVRGRPVSEQAQAVGLRIGLAMVGTLMLTALYFDLMRLW